MLDAVCTSERGLFVVTYILYGGTAADACPRLGGEVPPVQNAALRPNPLDKTASVKTPCDKTPLRYLFDKWLLH